MDSKSPVEDYNFQTLTTPGTSQITSESNMDASATTFSSQTPKPDSSSVSMGSSIATCSSDISDVGELHHNANSIHSLAIKELQKGERQLTLEDFRKLKVIGVGGSGIVYVAELLHTKIYYAVKVKKIDNESEKNIKKEMTLLKMLDHPLLPTLYFYCEKNGKAYIVTEYCSGDLNMLRHRQPGRRFPEDIVRFYVAEIVLTLEYLHMLGIVYRDLKPENVLVKDDGHLMLTDFDLCRLFSVVPNVIDSSKCNHKIKSKGIGCSKFTCKKCLKSSLLSCFSYKSSKTRAEMKKERLSFIAEPNNGHSDSILGTREYLAPEIVEEKGHGNAVDWWTLGIFMFELLYGFTPFTGTTKEDTNWRIANSELNFPPFPNVTTTAKDLMKALLKKKPEKRLGYVCGAAEIKKHPFFKDIKWSLMLSRSSGLLPTLPKITPLLEGIAEGTW